MNAAMEKTSREKIALIVFLILAIGMGCILFGYVFAGHSWNVTASNIDDAFGNMEGYTAIVYEGTIEEEESAAQSSASATSAANGSANSKNAGDAESLPGDSKAGDGQASASSSSSSDGNQASASSSENSQASSAASPSDKQTASSQGGSSVASVSPTSATAQGTGCCGRLRVRRRRRGKHCRGRGFCNCFPWWNLRFPGELRCTPRGAQKGEGTGRALRCR